MGVQTTAANKQPASAGTLGERGCGGPSAQVLALRVLGPSSFRTIKQQKNDRQTKRSWPRTHKTHLVTIVFVLLDYSLAVCEALRMYIYGIAPYKIIQF